MLENETADSAFLELENKYPSLCKETIANGFGHWSQHREFFLSFMQMMRARSLLFREQKQAAGKDTLAWEIAEDAHETKTIKLKSMTPTPVSPTFIRNRAISEMMEEIKKGAAWLQDFDWALRYCDSVNDPFIISEIPFVARGPCTELEKGIWHPETLLFFPLCWQACLIGSRQSFDVKTDRFDSRDMQTMRQIYREAAQLFILAPSKVW